MNIYIDTSSLFKLYHEEAGSQELVKFLESQKSVLFFISDITNVEYTSTVYKKLRNKEISFENLTLLLNSFNSDIKKFQIVPLGANTNSIVEHLFFNYGQSGLRALDALQLCCALLVKPVLDVVITSDKLLAKFLTEEGFSVSFF